MSTTAAVLVTLAAAGCFAVAVVFQQEAAVEAQAAARLPHNSVFGLARSVLRRRVWLLATTLDFVGFLLQATALHLGRITVVQPLLVTVLALGMLLGAWRSHTRLGAGDLFGLLFLCAGIAGFLLAAAPSAGGDRALPGRLPMLVFSVLGLLAVAFMVSTRLHPRGQSVMLALGAGAAFAVVAALAKEVGGQLTGGGALVVLGHWPVYALAVVAISGLSIEQTAFAAGPLVPTLVTLTLVDPLASLCTGSLVYGETLQGGVAAVAGAASSGLLTVAGVVLVARSRATARVQSPESIVERHPVDVVRLPG